MALPRKLVIAPNAATRELWRIAESGAIDELEGVLPQADINGRNEHGMTALMRAAYHGRAQMVRVLLDHGADPNVARNDNFTALSLAAFFGHAEIVDMLMGRGANVEVSTRFGTSPYIWAKARSYGDVAQCLEKRRAARQQSVAQERVLQEPVAQERILQEPVAREPVSQELPSQPVVVRTLKDPPEIWDLVHEAPRNFNASSAFKARISSTKGGFLMIAAVLLVVIGAGIGAAIYFKDRLPSVGVPGTAATTTAPPAVTKPAEANKPVTETSNPVAETNSAVADTQSVVASEPVSNEFNTAVTRRPRPVARTRANSGEVKEQSDTAQAVAPPVVDPPKVNLPAATDAEKQKAAAPLGPQMISPPKSTPPKAKVIQWP